MKQVFLLAALITVLSGLMSGMAQADDYPIGPALETLTVPFTISGAHSTLELQDGVRYWLLAEGVVSAGYSGQESDAEWYRNPGAPPYPEWSHEADFSGYPPHTYDLVVDEIGYDWWGSPDADPDPLLDFDTFVEPPPLVFSPSHKYWVPIWGDGTTIHLRIVDHPSHYHDNSGSLAVGIYTPEPATLSLLALGGLAMLRRRRVRVGC